MVHTLKCSCLLFYSCLLDTITFPHWTYTTTTAATTTINNNKNNRYPKHFRQHAPQHLYKLRVKNN